jgi:hypothetical protein
MERVQVSHKFDTAHPYKILAKKRSKYKIKAPKEGSASTLSVFLISLKA